jgi:5-(carboxyamino)imidazole ribonucleotide synthase
VTLGVLGAGQLGQMLGFAATKLGIDTCFLDPAETPCAERAGPVIQAEYADAAALLQLAQRATVASFEFENVPPDALRFLDAQGLRVAPNADALQHAQDRGVEKALFDRLGIPVAPYRCVDDLAAAQAAVITLGVPAVIKTRRFGYDGKGQVVIRDAADVAAAWQAIGEQPAIVEAWVPFEREVSCLGVRSRDGEARFYPLTTNTHRDGILRLSVPSANDPLQTLAEQYTRKVMDTLGYVGVMAFEFFIVNNQLLGNEIAPRVHNSGHWTQDGAVTSQFENHVRAVCDLPLGDTALLRPVAMINLVGQMPDPSIWTEHADQLRVHDYGKSARRARKVGHVNLWAADAPTLALRVSHLSTLISPFEDG